MVWNLLMQSLFEVLLPTGNDTDELEENEDE